MDDSIIQKTLILQQQVAQLITISNNLADMASTTTTMSSPTFDQLKAIVSSMDIQMVALNSQSVLVQQVLDSITDTVKQLAG